MKQWEIAEIVAEVDKEGTGELGIAEFLEIMTNTMARLAEEKDGKRQPTVGGEEGCGISPSDWMPYLRARGGFALLLGPAGLLISGEGAESLHDACCIPDFQVPFGLVATAYRRKRMLEGIMTADKEVRAQLAQLSDKQAQEAMIAQTILGE